MTIKFIIIAFTVLHLLSHVIPSSVMAYHLWHMHKFHGKSKWKIIYAVVMIAVCIGTLVELPDILHSLSNQCG